MTIDELIVLLESYRKALGGGAPVCTVTLTNPDYEPYCRAVPLEPSGLRVAQCNTKGYLGSTQAGEPMNIILLIDS